MDGSAEHNDGDARWVRTASQSHTTFVRASMGMSVSENPIAKDGAKPVASAPVAPSTPTSAGTSDAASRSRQARRDALLKEQGILSERLPGEIANEANPGFGPRSRGMTARLEQITRDLAAIDAEEGAANRHAEQQGQRWQHIALRAGGVAAGAALGHGTAAAIASGTAKRIEAQNKVLLELGPRAQGMLRPPLGSKRPATGSPIGCSGLRPRPIMPLPLLAWLP